MIVEKIVEVEVPRTIEVEVEVVIQRPKINYIEKTDELIVERFMEEPYEGPEQAEEFEYDDPKLDLAIETTKERIEEWEEKISLLRSEYRAERERWDLIQMQRKQKMQLEQEWADLKTELSLLERRYEGIKKENGKMKHSIEMSKEHQDQLTAYMDCPRVVELRDELVDEMKLNNKLVAEIKRRYTAHKLKCPYALE